MTRLRLLEASLCVMTYVAAIVPALAQDACRPAAADNPPASDALTPASHVQDYHAVFQACRAPDGGARLAIRRMTINGAAMLLTVDPATLATRLDDAACLACVDTTDEEQANTRFVQAVEHAGTTATATPHKPVDRDAGLVHGVGDGAFVTGDLCPSHRPLDRAFFTALAANGAATPVALSISGLWLAHHIEDFRWLQAQDHAGALAITWVDHSYRHPFAPGVAFDRNFLLTPGVDMQAEIDETERLLIANGGTPSVFFRFPGLISDAAVMDVVRRNHLVALGADAWLVLSPPPRPGAIVLVHPNGNEEQGLRLFSRLIAQHKMPQPFRPIADAP